VLPAAETNDSWGQPGGNASKAMGHLGLGATLSRAWQAEIPGSTKRERLAAAPVVAENRLFVMDVEGTINAFAADTGAKLWTVETVKDKENARARFGGGVSTENGRVYATNGLGDLVVVDAASGAEVWRAHPAGPLRGAPTIANGQVYVTSQDNQLYALKIEDGSPEWDTAATLEIAGVFGAAAPAVAQGTVVAGFSSGELNAYRYENGRAVWGDMLARTGISTSVSTLSDIDAEPVIDEGKVYAVGQGGRMAALDITTGQRLWELNIAGVASPAVAGEWVFVVTDQAKLLCIARSSGKVRWLAELPRWRTEK
jgi:outer membrane protein assembly factor BamB